MINLPEKFANDIQGRETFIVPAIKILLTGSNNENDFLYVSTSKITIAGNHYQALINKAPKITTSTGTPNTKSFKVSNLKLTLSDIKYKKNEYLSDIIMKGGVMNARVKYYLKTPSAKALEDCFLAFEGHIRNITHNSGQVVLDVEDGLEAIVGKSVPQRHADPRNLPDVHKNKLIPIVYGYVDKAPLIYMSRPSFFNSNTQMYFDDWYLMADDAYITLLTDAYIYDNNAYARMLQETNIFQEAAVGSVFTSCSEVQYRVEWNIVIMPKNIDTEAFGTSTELRGSPIQYNLCEVVQSTQAGLVSSNQKVEAIAWLQPQESVNQDAKLRCYYDQSGVFPQRDPYNPSFVLAKDFQDQQGYHSFVGDDGYPYQYWLWGHNKDLQYGEAANNEHPYYGYEYIQGYSELQFQTREGSISSEKTVTELQSASSETDVVTIDSRVRLQYDLRAAIRTYAHTQIGGGGLAGQNASFGRTNNPIMYFQWLDNGEMPLALTQVTHLRHHQVHRELCRLLKVGKLQGY